MLLIENFFFTKFASSSKLEIRPLKVLSPFEIVIFFTTTEVDCGAIVGGGIAGAWVGVGSNTGAIAGGSDAGGDGGDDMGTLVGIVIDMEVEIGEGIDGGSNTASCVGVVTGGIVVGVDMDAVVKNCSCESIIAIHISKITIVIIN